MFAEGSDNEKIVQAYGTYNFWSWLRYWYLDSASFVLMLIVDKGYYDYDFEPVVKIVDAEKTALSDDKLESISKKFGFGGRTRVEVTEENIDELQQRAMKNIND